MADYFPSEEANQRAWIVQFLAQLTNYSTTLGLSAGEVSGVTTAGMSATTAMDDLVSKNNAYESALAERDTVLKNFTTTLRPLVRRMKSATAYTPTIGETLGIVGENTPVDPTQIKPSLTATVNIGFVRLRVRRDGAENVAVYCRRVAETDWTLLGRATRAVYDDYLPLHTPGVPEIREYMVQGYLGDTQVGQPSDPRVVVFAGAIAA